MQLSDEFPIIWDVGAEYRKRRHRGKGREEAIAEVLDYFSSELADSDDGPQVWIGLAQVTSGKKELTSELMMKAQEAFDQLSEMFPEVSGSLLSARERVCDPGKVGPEAKYSKKRIYKPVWAIGDTFIYRLQGERAVKLGLLGCYAVLRKVGEEFNNQDDWIQSVYLTVCTLDRIPKTAADLSTLGIIPCFGHLSGGIKKYEYQRGLYITSPQRERAAQLTKIGCFPDAAPPPNEEINPFGVSYPLVPYANQPFFQDVEDYLCSGYRDYGALIWDGDQIKALRYEGKI